MHKLGIIIGLFLVIVQLLGFQPEEIIREIENIRETKKEEKLVTGLKGLFDDEGDLWLSWNEHDRKPKDWRETIFASRQHCTYWYAQKFNSKGESYFPAVELAKREIGYGISAPIYLGNLGDVYTFPGSSFRIERVDNEGNHYTSSKNYSYYAGNMFIDQNGIMYVFSKMQGLRKTITKFKMQKPLPVFIEEQQLPSRFDAEKYGKNYINYPYNWLGSNLIYCNKTKNHAVAFLPLTFNDKILPDSQEVKVYDISLPDLISVDTSSFQINAALYKKIKGCKLEASTLIEGNGDTLILYLPSRGASEDLIYVCKLTKNGEPIKSKEIIEEEVKDFDEAPKELHKEIVFRGTVIGNLNEPTGIMIYGFDKSGNIYYYVWDKSDDYWKKK